MNKQSALEIKRSIPGKKAATQTLCYPGRVTVLIDEAGDGVLHTYKCAFAGEKTDEKFSFKLQGQKIALSDEVSVGFGEKLPEQSSIGDFLHDAGYTADEVQRLIDEHDLEQYSYLPCGGLNATATRQLLLLELLKNDTQVLVLNDPFMPFNGRWREDFAKRIVEYAVDHNKIVVVTNLSFMPQTWTKAEQVVTIDVGKAAERARERAEQMAALEDVAKAAADAVPDAPKAKDSGEKKEDWELPPHLQFAYKGVYDWIFAPLAGLSNTVRTYSGMAVPLSVICIGLVIGGMMYPNLPYFREKLKELAATFDDPSATPMPIVSSTAKFKPEQKKASFEQGVPSEEASVHRAAVKDDIEIEEFPSDEDQELDELDEDAEVKQLLKTVVVDKARVEARHAPKEHVDAVQKTIPPVEVILARAGKDYEPIHSRAPEPDTFAYCPAPPAPQCGVARNVECHSSLEQLVMEFVGE